MWQGSQFATKGKELGTMRKSKLIQIGGSQDLSEKVAI